MHNFLLLPEEISQVLKQIKSSCAKIGPNQNTVFLTVRNSEMALIIIVSLFPVLGCN